MIWTRKYIKYAHVQESNHICTARTYARVCGSWAVRPFPILYSLKFLREHPHTNQLQFDLFFNASSLFRCYQSCSFIFHLFCLVLTGKFVLKYSRGDIAMLWSLNIVDCRDHFSKKVKLSLFYARLNSRKN